MKPKIAVIVAVDPPTARADRREYELDALPPGAEIGNVVRLGAKVELCKPKPKTKRRYPARLSGIVTERIESGVVIRELLSLERFERRGWLETAGGALQIGDSVRFDAMDDDGLAWEVMRAKAKIPRDVGEELPDVAQALEDEASAFDFDLRHEDPSARKKSSLRDRKPSAPGAAWGTRWILTRGEQRIFGAMVSRQNGLTGRLVLDVDPADREAAREIIQRGLDDPELTLRTEDGAVRVAPAKLVLYRSKYAVPDEAPDIELEL